MLETAFAKYNLGPNYGTTRDVDVQTVRELWDECKYRNGNAFDLAEELSIGHMSYVAWVFKECPKCGAPILCHQVTKIPKYYDYEDAPMDGMPSYCIGVSTSSTCWDCREE